MQTMKLVYVAGPFSADDGWGVAQNVHRAETAARAVLRLGAMPVTPHSIGARMAGTETQELWRAGTLALMRRCDAVLVLPGYEKSAGTLGEIEEAKRLRMPLFLPDGDGPEAEPDFAALSAWVWATPEPRTLGQTGYEAYAAHTGGLTWDGKPMPTWADILVREGDRPRVTAAWESAAEAIAARARDPDRSGGHRG